MPNPRGYEVLGIANPVLDHILQISQNDLEAISGEKGGMETVDYETLSKLIENSETNPPLLVAGGSGTNVIKGLVEFGETCAVTGMIGNDLYGKKYLNRLLKHGIIPLYDQSSSPTAQVACLITPDGERTCRTYLGASQEMNESFLKPEYFEGVRLVHIEGYSMLNGALTEKSMELAKEAGAKISFDLGSFELVAKYKERILKLISHYVDILFANMKETFTLTELEPEAGSNILKDLCEIAIVSMGKEGCWVGYQNQNNHYPAFPVVAVDSTGAGDLFASGFLHGYLQGKEIAECTRYGALAGAAVVQTYGTEISPEKWAEIKLAL